MDSRAVCGTKGPRGERDKLRNRRSRGANGVNAAVKQGDWVVSLDSEREGEGRRRGSFVQDEQRGLSATDEPVSAP